ncbi:MAG TPA: hypothetical protein VG937_27820 [Polyangiaceae bacterium]|nr:hypothetical protein [Polyangiaceae bacterium]
MRRAISRIALSFALAPSLTLVGCNRLDPAKCDEALKVTRDAIDKENFSGAQQWREYAWKQCEDRSTLESLDRQLVAKRGEVEAREKAAAERRQAKTQLLKVFLGWVAENRLAPDRASASPSCDPPAANDPKKDESKERLCTATRAAGPHQLLARYWAAEPAIARFNVKLPDVATCEEIGATKLLKTWQVAATGGRTTPRFRCEFPSGALAGMNVVLSQAINADLYVFNPSYLDKEPALRLILDGS